MNITYIIEFIYSIDGNFVKMYICIKQCLAILLYT